MPRLDMFIRERELTVRSGHRQDHCGHLIRRLIS